MGFGRDSGENHACRVQRREGTSALTSAHDHFRDERVSLERRVVHLPEHDGWMVMMMMMMMMCVMDQRREGEVWVCDEVCVRGV